MNTVILLTYKLADVYTNTYIRHIAKMLTPMYVKKIDVLDH